MGHRPYTSTLHYSDMPCNIPQNRVLLINVVALSKALIRPDTMPNIHHRLFGSPQEMDIPERSIFMRGYDPLEVVTIEPTFPAVTCTAQATYLTGKGPGIHGIIGNGWYDRSCAEVRNWHQSARLVDATRLPEKLKRQHPDATTAWVGWWHGMYDTSIDFLVTPRPQYLANGGKRPDVYTKPEYLRRTLQEGLGNFPLHRFWGPTTSIASSQWLIKAAQEIERKESPTISFLYLPHLDYVLQKRGPNLDDELVRRDLQELDRELHALILFCEQRDLRVCMLSEYGIEAVSAPVHINRILREYNFLSVREENDGETLDPGASRAFAVADHQIAHVYIQNALDVQEVREVLSNISGVEHVLDAQQLKTYYTGNFSQRDAHHTKRSAELTVIAAKDHWFTYYPFLVADKAPDYAYTVAIHRKPGYDPCEMLFRYRNSFIGFAYLLWKLFLVYVLHLRLSVDGTPVDRANDIKGSHGRIPESDESKPVLIVPRSCLVNQEQATVLAEDVHDVIWRLLRGSKDRSSFTDGCPHD